jgi:hypothetical protein
MEVPPNKSVLMPPALFALRPEIYVVLERRDTSANTTVKGLRPHRFAIPRTDDDPRRGAN